MTDDQRFAAGRVRIGVGALVVGVLAAIAVTIAIGILRGGEAESEDVALPTATETVDEAAGVYVHVSGAVREPGLYRVPPGSRVLDAIAAAGGFADDADQAAVNLARPVSDGEQLHLPTPAEAEKAGGAAVDGGAVDVNRADASALETLPGIGPALAARIVAWREEHGPFGSVDDLLAVAGIGDKVLAGLRDLVRV